MTKLKCVRTKSITLETPSGEGLKILIYKGATLSEILDTVKAAWRHEVLSNASKDYKEFLEKRNGN